MSPTIETLFTITSEELEATYFHLNHCVLIKKLELARYDFLDKIGVPAADLIAQGSLTVVSELEVEFLREVKDGQIRVVSSVARVERKFFVMHQELFNERAKLALRADVRLACMSAETKRGIEIPAELVTRIKTERVDS